MLAWIAGEQWRIDTFKNGGDIYCASASKMFKVPVEKHGVNGELRQKGKISELACIAEGQLVLTDAGLIPIEKITLEHKLWDGEEWVSHDGVIYKGEQEVITYDGLTATKEHLVWVKGEQKPIQFGVAASCGAYIIQTGNDRSAIRLGESNLSRKKMECVMEPLLCINAMYRMWCNSVAAFIKSAKGKIKRLSKLFSATANSVVAGEETNGSKATVRKSTGQGLSQLWRKRNKIRIFKCYRGRIVFNQKIWSAEAGVGNRPYRQQWKLCTRQYSVCNTYGKQFKQTVYRIKSFFTEILALCKKCGNSEVYQTD